MRKITTQTDIKKIFFRCPYKIVVTLKENSFMSQVAKENDLTYAHVVKMLYLMKNENIITLEKKGRQVLIKLTDKGMKIQLGLRGIDNIINSLPIPLETKIKKTIKEKGSTQNA